MKPLSDLGEFRRLSAALSYVLTASTGSAERLLDMILGDQRMDSGHEEALIELIDYVVRAWAGSRRRLGPSAAVHPLRATALLVKALAQVAPIDLVVMLLHDKVEDVTAETMPPEAWEELEGWFRRLERRLDPEKRFDLDSRLRALARIDRRESYCGYLARLIDVGRRHPDVVRAKLADRLDNTLDFSVDFRDPLDEVDFFEQIFDCLYLPQWSGAPSAGQRRPAELLELSWRLYGLYKNIVLLSLLRSAGTAAGDGPSRTLMDAIVDAGLKEAQRIGLELLADPRRALTTGRDLLLDAMQYCNSGFAFRVTDAAAGHVLDGLLVNTFDTPDPEARVRQLEALAHDHRLLFEGAVTFLAMFSAFKLDPGFFVRGIDPGGVHPVE